MTGLHFEDVGDGAPVLLISGLNGLAQPWEQVTGLLGGLGRYRIVTHDHRGMGRSGPAPDRPSVDGIAADVLALMDALGIARAHIVGHSLGGAVAQAFAVAHPARVAGLVIYASWPGPDAYFARVMSMRRELLLAQGVKAFLRTGPIGIYPPDWIVRHDAAFEAALPVSLAKFPGVPAMLGRMDACLAHDMRAKLARIAAPTLVLGLQDDMSTPAHCSAELATAIHGARLAMLPYGGHNAHLVVPDQVARCLHDFFSLLPPDLLPIQGIAP